MYSSESNERIDFHHYSIVSRESNSHFVLHFRKEYVYTIGHFIKLATLFQSENKCLLLIFLILVMYERVRNDVTKLHISVITREWCVKLLKRCIVTE